MQPSSRKSKSRLSYAKNDDPPFKKVLIRTLEVLTGQGRIQRLYHEIYDMDLEPHHIWGASLRQLEVELKYDQKALASIPKEGPLVFISNHPYGVLDGLILGHLVSQVRPQFFILVNELLLGEALLDGFLLPVSFEETKAAIHQNIHTKQETIRRIKAGEAPAIFPGGGVATAKNWWKGEAEELQWKRFTAKVIQQTKPTVVPLFFPGQNSRLFQLASKIDAKLRLGLFINEIRNKMGKEIEIKIGKPMSHTELSSIKNRQDLLDHLQQQVMNLKP
ncbi:MAG: lysophospholipid acyltransferase family protein [Bacteroidota bacterium]